MSSESCAGCTVRFKFNRQIRKAELPHCFFLSIVLNITLSQGSGMIISSSQCLLQNVNMWDRIEVLLTKSSGRIRVRVQHQ